MALECVNEEFQHFFVVDTPPSTPIKKKKKSIFYKLLVSLLRVLVPRPSCLSSV